MSFIDEKGRIFGRVNIIDLVFILMILGIICTAIIYLNFMDKTVYYVQYEVCGTNAQNCNYKIPPFLANVINDGDTFSKDVHGVVKNVTFRKNEDGSYNYVLLLEVYSGSSGKLKVGNTLRIVSDKYIVSGRILAFSKEKPESNLKEQNSTITIKLTADDETIEQVKLGDTMVVDDEVVAKIVNITYKDIKRVIETDNGELVIQTEPLNKFMFVTINIKTNNFYNIMYFNDKPLNYDANLTFNFGSYALAGKVVEILRDETTGSLETKSEEASQTVVGENTGSKNSTIIVANSLR